MIKTSAWLIAGAVLATAGVAHAQETPTAAAINPVTEQSQVRAAVPWYERFTTSTGVTENISGFSENNDRFQPTWNLSQRWGVTVDVHQAQRVERGTDHVAPEQTNVGAYYQFTPRVRVGGEVSLQNRDTPVSAPAGSVTQPQQSAGVKLESAFRF